MCNLCLDTNWIHDIDLYIDDPRPCPVCIPQPEPTDDV